MVAYDKPEIDFSQFPESDGEPMAETSANVVQMVDLIYALRTLLIAQQRMPATVSGNQFVYYNPLSGRDNISPDVYVVFDSTVMGPAKWQTWVEGKFPDIVFEITSPSTEQQDLSDEPGGKRRLYARLGAREYYIYDPQLEMVPPFQGFSLRDGRMEPLPILPSGGISSPLLETELRPMTMAATQRHMGGAWLRVIDPWSGQPIAVSDEEHDALEVTQEQLTETREELTETREELTEAREELTAEARTRIAAEARAARAEAALQALLAEQARRQDSTGGE